MNNHAQIRSNLDELKHKLNSGICKIAYMGSSVTVQKEGYRIFLHDALKEYFNQEHLEICAAIGGVGAITGVFTMVEDVIKYAPDLCFIEYMVSDRIEVNTPQSEIGKVIEGIVRKLNQINCEIIFLYRYIGQELIDTRYDYARNEYEKIADYYRISSIDFGKYIQASIEQKKYTHEDLFKDHTHTNQLGSKVAANYIVNTLIHNIFKSNLRISNNQNIKPVYSENYKNTAIVYINEKFLAKQSNYSKGACKDKVKNHQSKSKDYQYIEIASDNSFKFKIKGELIGLMLIVGRDSGIMEISANNKLEKVILWDKWCHYDRFSTTILSKKYSRLTEVEIKITDELIDYSSCRREIINPEQIVKKIKLVGIMTRSNTEIIPINSDPQTLTIPDLINSAKLWESKKNYKKALSFYLKAVQISSNQRACNALARYIIRREKSQNKELDLILAVHSSPIFYSNLGHVFYKLEEFERSIVCFRKAIVHNSRLAEDLLPIIQSAKLKTNKQNEAVKTYKEWIETYYIINHKHKIIYCPIPKNACTLFKEIIVSNSEHKLGFQQSGLDVHRYIRQNDVALADFKYLSDSEYLKIAIVRNPFDRLVSAYLNKFVRPKKVTQIVKNVIRDIYKFNNIKPNQKKSVTFSDFIEHLARTEDHYLNEHWRSQYFFLGMGLFEFDVIDSLKNVGHIIQKIESRMEIEIINNKTKNKTNYSEKAAKKDWHQMYPEQLRTFKQLPSADSLYTSELTNLVKNRYASDIEIYESIENRL